MKLNVIIPCYNEAGNIELMYEKLTECLKDIKYELIFINDGSKDETENIIKEIYIKDKKHVRFINFSRNFGKDAAMYAGLTHANAEYTVIVDGDLQQNPSYLLKMLNFLEENPDYDQVAMINTKRSIWISAKNAGCHCRRLELFVLLLFTIIHDSSVLISRSLI